MRLRQFAVLVAGLLALAQPCQARHAFVDAPSVPWDEFAPYVHANVAPYVRGEEFFVMVCSGAAIQSVAEPFDERLSDFAKVLLLQRAQSDPRFATAMRTITDGVRARLIQLTAPEREQYRSMFWAALDGDPYIASTLRADYERAQRRGRVRCRVCEQDPSFSPVGLRR